MPLTQLSPNLCSKQYSTCRGGEGKLWLPAPLHGPVYSPAKSRRWDGNARDQVTPLLHMRTAHAKAERRAHKYGGEQRQIALGYVSTLKTIKKSRNHFYWGQNSLEPITQLLSGSHAAFAKSRPSVGSCRGSRVRGTARPARGSSAQHN